jgi:O-antigen/teichoic acid export membrane protein
MRGALSTRNVTTPMVVQSRSEAAEKRPLIPSLLTGMGALGVSLGFERGAGFISNVLGARLAGAQAFGAYSLALTTATNVASYAGAGIGTTANRFVGQYPPGTRGYRSLLRALSMVSVASAAIAALILWLGAAPLARVLLRNTKLVGPLQIAALSAAAFILLECCRGLLIGERRFSSLLLLSVMVGAGLLLMVPSTARFGPAPMLAGQASAVMMAVLTTTWLVYRLAHSRPFLANDNDNGAGPSVWGVWSFGLVQLTGVIGLNAAGWWVASLVARYDPSLVQMAFYAIASQLRNVAALAPSLVGQCSFAMLTEEGGQDFGGSGRVLTVSTLVASLLATLCAGMAILVLPWLLRYLYGSAYRGAELASSFAIATALVHMSSSPAASRLTVVSLRVTGVINLVWAVFVFALGSWFVPRQGAVAAAASFFAAHVLSMILVLIWLRHLGVLPPGVVSVSMLNVAIAGALLGVSWLRVSSGMQPLLAAGACATLTGAGAFRLWRMGRAQGVVPGRVRFTDLRYFLSDQRSISSI